MDDRLCGYCSSRAGKVYKIGDAEVPLHPNCRCYLAPWREEWQELGLTDDEWAAEHRRKSLDRASEPPKTGASPSERWRGQTEAPKAAWSPDTPPAPRWTPLAEADAQALLDRTSPHVEWTQAQQDAVREYTGLDYRGVNAGLRNIDGATLDKSQRRVVRQIDQALDGRTLPVDAELWRGYSLPGAQVADDPAKMIGTLLNDPAFMSTSLTKERAFMFAEQADPSWRSVVVTVRGQANRTPGAYVRGVSRNADREAEFLLPRNTSLRVIEASVGTDPAWGGPNPYFQIIAEVVGAD